MKYVQFVPLVIEDYEATVMRFPLHTHTYYEMVYIHSGTGTHTLNGKIFAYGKGDIFLISPTDEHVIVIDELTHFTVIKFTSGYIGEHSSDKKLLGKIESVMRNALAKEFKPFVASPFDEILKSTINNLVLFRKSNLLSSSNWIFHQFLSIIDILKESLFNNESAGKNEEEDVLNYIHNHIYSPNDLRIKNIAAHFNKSSLYFSNYFKKQYGKSLRDYTQQYRLQLIENRLKNSIYTIKQIAEEFGFQDKSHFYRFFKSMRNINPAAFRQSMIEQQVSIE